MSEKEPFAEAPKSASDKEPSAEARKSALESDYAALYAVAGLTDALAEALKGARSRRPVSGSMNCKASDLN